jgi:hypothetical protein
LPQVKLEKQPAWLVLWIVLQKIFERMENLINTSCIPL